MFNDVLFFDNLTQKVFQLYTIISLFSPRDFFYKGSDNWYNVSINQLNAFVTKTLNSLPSAITILLALNSDLILSDPLV